MAFKLNLDKKKPLVKTSSIDGINNGVYEQLDLEKYSGYDKAMKEGLNVFFNTYEKRKKIFHDGGSMAIIYELPFCKNNLIIKETRKNIHGGAVVNGPKDELKIQDDLYDLDGLDIPFPVAYIGIKHVDVENKKITERNLIIMEKIEGLSIGDNIREVRGGRVANLPSNFSINVFMEKLEKQVEIMHKHNFYHRDLTINNVLINKEGNPVIIDFGSSTESTYTDPYEHYSTTLVKNEKRTITGGSIVFKDDRESLDSIRESLKLLINS